MEQNEPMLLAHSGTVVAGFGMTVGQLQGSIKDWRLDALAEPTVVRTWEHFSSWPSRSCEWPKTSAVLNISPELSTTSTRYTSRGRMCFRV